MDPAELALDPDELRRLAECAKEPIRTPGSIQGHGTLLGIDQTGVIAVASENAARWLGQPVLDIGNAELEYAVRTGRAVDPVRITWEGVASDAIVHRADGLTLVEIEPVPEGNEYARTAVVGAIMRVATTTSIDELRTMAAAEIRDITGFDRVMVYHFHDDGHGEIVADEHAPDLEPYLGLHFPASDIPPQARALYISKVGRMIASTTDPGIPLVALEGDARTVDLSDAELRSVSPYHLQYMRNMGQASTFSLSLVEHGRLIGMITCAHRTERRLPVLLRRALEVLAGQIALQIGSMGEIARLRHMVEVRERRAELLAPLYGSDDIHAALLSGSQTVLDLVPADGVLVRIGDTSRSGGEVPPLGAVLRALERLGGGPFVSEALSVDRPDVAQLLPGVAGLLVVPLTDAGEVLVFFRGEVSREISWLGDPGGASRAGELSPRTSFSAWQRTVRGRSEPWGTVVEEAAELGHELEIALQRRAEAQLAELAMRDALTGLYNRRYLVERLATRGPVGEAGKGVLFVDLDDFKSVNDRHGHDVGDAVILEVANRLVTHSREQDVVVRLGGDEFVVLLDGVIDEDVEAVADRMVRAIAAPIATGQVLLSVTASCGIVVAEPGSPRAGLLEAADAAMYRAKHAGRNRVSH
ncbi:diguanylate cyclase [Agromyces sp. CFH 90414]|uniref:Diguanylate cyclase n=1 Tax=Agromyces agglutinans TaxID=2662258 RepID=A0A6I2F735_9MICO|nr:diguanylate cyclase [Agromyces agglutinans]MRG59597.1 diguanylate cyclase [Agromyces agglutinans]